MGKGFDSKYDFTPPTVLLRISFALGHGVSFYGGIQYSELLLSYAMPTLPTISKQKMISGWNKASILVSQTKIWMSAGVQPQWIQGNSKRGQSQHPRN